MTHTAETTDNPEITEADKRVDREELFKRHNGFEDVDGSGVNIVVQDTGLDESHPWVQKQTSDTEMINFTDESDKDKKGHGTMVTDLATRYATGASVEMHKCLPSDDLDVFYDSFERILDNPEDYDVLVMSWTVKKTQVDKVDDYINEIANEGIIPIAAAGNSHGEAGSPATAKKCISIGALTEDGESVTNFSSWDKDDDPEPGFEGIPEVSAIGKSVIGANAENGSLGHGINGTTTVASGTSFSCPFIANLVVDIVRRLDDPTVKEVLIELEDTAVDIEKTSRDGLGRVNHEKALESIINKELDDEEDENDNSSSDPPAWYVQLIGYIIRLLSGSRKE
jgi:subtilisin family serine protease